MNFRLYNTLSKQIEDFRPGDPERITFYTCGPTVYDDAHIGNFRSFLAADLLRRWLESPLCTLLHPDGSTHSGPREVIHVMNITDVGHMTDDADADGAGQDKMMAAAQRIRDAKKAGKLPENVGVNPDDPYAVAEFYQSRFLEDARALGLKVAIDAETMPERMPRATGHIDGMKRVIARLLDENAAYAAGEPGRRAVYFDVRAFQNYGKLSGNTLDQLRGGAGGRVDETNQQEKRHPADFLLWKEDATHKMKWPSPDHPALSGWSPGYPGWHIECTAMALERLLVPRSREELIRVLSRLGHCLTQHEVTDVSQAVEVALRICGNIDSSQQRIAGSRFTRKQFLASALVHGYLASMPEGSFKLAGSHLATFSSIPKWKTLVKHLNGLDIILLFDKLHIPTSSEIDLHSGGEDNIFPHHECEIAQSCAFTHAPRFARHWFHPRFLMVDGAKMSKSKGTFFTPRELMAKGIDPAAIRLELIKTHYRANADFSHSGLDASSKRINHWRYVARSLIAQTTDNYVHASEAQELLCQTALEQLDGISSATNPLAALSDDLKVSALIALLDTVGTAFREKPLISVTPTVHQIPSEPWSNQHALSVLKGSEQLSERACGALHLIDNILGVIFRPVAKSQDTGIAVYLPGTTPSDEVETLLAERRDAKKAKDFARSDAIRDQLAGMGYAIKDMPGGRVEVGRA